MGWEELNKLKKKQVAQDSAFTRLASQIFLHEPGKEFLQLLKDEYLMSPVANPTESAAVAYYREGQNSVIRRIIRAIQVKNEAPTKEKA